MIRSTLLVGILTFLSRIFGFIRDMVIAYAFGASTNISADAFLIAFKIPNFMRRLFAEGAFSQAFVPVLSEYKTQNDEATVKQLINNVAGHLGGILIGVVIIGIISAPILTFIFAPGFSQYPEKFSLTVSMLRITFPYLFFIALAAFAASILNTYGKFAIPAFTPILLNISLIGTALWLTPYFEQPVMALAWGVFFAGLLQLLFLLPFLKRLNLLPRPHFQRDSGVKRIYKLMLPALFGVSVSQINLLIDTLMASFLVTGSVSWLYYSDRLMEFPVGVFGLALATVMLPNLSKSVARGDMQSFSNTLDWALRWVFIVATPATIGLLILAGPILATLFHHGEFTAHDVMKSSASLVAYSFGLLGFVLVKVLVSGFYSRMDTGTPVKIAVIAMLTNITLNLLFIMPLQHVGLAFATSLAATVNAALLYYYLRKQAVFQPNAGWHALLLRIIIAAIGMAIVLWWGCGAMETWLNTHLLERGLRLLGWVTVGMVVYFLTLFIIGLRPAHLRLMTEKVNN